MCIRLRCCRPDLRDYAVEDAGADGYEAAQIGLVEFVKDKNVTKPQAGHFAKSEAPPVKVIRKSRWSWTLMALWLPRPATACWWTSSPRQGLWT